MCACKGKERSSTVLTKELLSSRIARQESTEAKVINGMCDACYK